MNNPFYNKLAILINKPSDKTKEVSAESLKALVDQARLNNFPIYSLLVATNIEKKGKVSDKSVKLEGWVSTNKNQIMSDVKNTRSDNQKFKNNNFTLILIIAIVVVVSIIIGIFILLPNEDKADISEETAWNNAIKKNTERSIKLYTKMFPRGNHAFEADSALYALKQAKLAEKPPEVRQPISIKLSKDIIENLEEGSNAIISVKISPDTEEYKVSCSNNNINYQISNNYITISGVRPGNSILTVYASSNPNKAVYCNITVIKRPKESPAPPEETDIKVSSINFTNPISSLGIDESYTYGFNIRPNNANTVLSISLKVGNRGLVQAPTSIYPNSREIVVKGKEIGKTQIWLQIEQNDGTTIFSDKLDIEIVPNIVKVTSIQINNKNEFSKEFEVGDYIPNISISYNPQNTTQKGVDIYFSNANVLEYDSYRREYKAKNKGTTYVIASSKEDSEISDRVKITVNEKIKLPSIDNKIYSTVEIDAVPMFKNGKQAYSDFLKKNLKYPDLASEKGTSGKVFLSFVVEKDGSITNVKVLKGIGDGCDKEAKRVLELMPKWIPGKIKSKPVRVKYNLYILFELY